MDNNFDPQNSQPQPSADITKEYEEIIKKYQEALAQAQNQAQPEPAPEPQPQPAPQPQPEPQPVSPPVIPAPPVFTPAPEPAPFSPPPQPQPVPQPEPIPQPPLNPTEPEKVNPIYKILFFFSLLLFLGVLGAIVFSLFKSQNNTSAGTPPIEEDIEVISPTTTPTASGTCILNDKSYTVNQTFDAADGCNICTCGSDFQVTCTANDCSPTRAASSSGKKITPILTPKTTPTPKPTI